jgi:hypothetical protein
MLQVHDGQCGLCAYFGEAHGADHSPSLLQIRRFGTSKAVPAILLPKTLAAARMLTHGGST